MTINLDLYDYTDLIGERVFTSSDRLGTIIGVGVAGSAEYRQEVIYFIKVDDTGQVVNDRYFDIIDPDPYGFDLNP